MTYLTRAKKVFDIEIDALRKTKAALGKEFDRAIDLIVAVLQRKGKIVVTGVGKSGNIGHKIAATLTSTGATSVVLDSTNAMHGDLGVISDGDIVLALSYSGETDELLRVLPAIKRFDVTVIAMTGDHGSSLAQHSDLVLPVCVAKEACPFNLAPTSTTTAMLALGDALAMCILEARGFKQTDYARLHPAGAIGRAMLLRIRDIMRTDDRNPTISRGKTVKDAILAMTRAKAGMISVTDGRGKLAGVFTDGDFRRQIARDAAALDAKIETVMTRKPTTIREDALAVEALRVFQERRIDDLIVVDDKNRPVGIIDSQDLPKFKVM
jgi:arabinose-5-phosphate isomerase